MIEVLLSSLISTIKQLYNYNKLTSNQSRTTSGSSPSTINSAISTLCTWHLNIGQAPAKIKVQSTDVSRSVTITYSQ